MKQGADEMKSVMNGDVVAWYEATYDQLPKALQPSAKKDWSSSDRSQIWKITFLVTPEKDRIWGCHLTGTTDPKPVPAPSKDDVTRKLIDDLKWKAYAAGPIRNACDPHMDAAYMALLKHLGLEK